MPAAAKNTNSNHTIIDPKHNAWVDLTNNVIYKPNIPSEHSPKQQSSRPGRPLRAEYNQHSLRAENQISEEALRQYLESKKSPLSTSASTVLASPYWSTIIGICHIEQYSCSRRPGGTNWNLWGIMKPGGGLQFYGTAEEGLQAINSFLERAETRGRTTVESFRGWYCVNQNYAGNICPNWESTVLRVKAEVESL